MKVTMNSVKRFAAGAAAVATMATVAALSTAAPASAAAGGGQLEVCSNGNYRSYVEFPARGGWSTTIINQGACRTFNIGTSNNVESIVVRGIYNTSSNTFWVGNGSIRPSLGGNVVTYGTTAANNHWALTPRV